MPGIERTGTAAGGVLLLARGRFATPLEPDSETISDRLGHLYSMNQDRAIFQDVLGRGWLVEIQYGHPAPAEMGIFAARFTCPEDPAESVRLGYVKMEWVSSADEGALRMALSESDPAEPIG